MTYNTSIHWMDHDICYIGLSEHVRIDGVSTLTLPKMNRKFKKSERMCVVSSKRECTAIYAPFDCQVVKQNDVLLRKPELVMEYPTYIVGVRKL